MKYIINFKKIISLITMICLLISFVVGPTAASAMTNEEATKKYKQIFTDFMLPYDYGQIVSSHYAGTDRLIINIQDLHCHPQVQKNISNIIETFDKSYGVKKVYLEGVYGQISTEWITKRIEKNIFNEVLDKMLQTGRLTGAEYYSAISGKTEIITGLEEKEPYLENLKRFGEIVSNKEKIELILKAIEESTLKLKNQYYTQRQFKLEELSKEYKEGKITPQKYYALLSKHTDRLGIDLTKYENTFTYVMLLELQKHLDYTKITSQLQNLVFMLKENLNSNAYQMLVDNTENFSKLDKVYGYIIKISRQLNLDLEVNFAELDKYFRYIELSQKINPLELISEEERLTEEINTKFSDTKAQREVVFLTNFERYLKDYILSKITSDDYEYYKENIEIYRKLWNKYIDNKVLSLLDEYITEADKFYKINTDRNIYFTDNIFKDSDVLNKIETEIEAKDDVNKIIENMKQVKEVDVVITGGFHSQTVTEILKNHGVSYIVITPNVVEGTKLAEETYYKIAKEQSKISFQALATLPFAAYPEKLRVKAAITAFGEQIAKEIFGEEKINVSLVDNEITEDKVKNVAEEFKTKKEIILAKLSESDDEKKIVDIINENLSQGNQLSEDELVNITEEQLVELSENKELLEKVASALKEGPLKQAFTLTIDNVNRLLTTQQKNEQQQQEEIENPMDTSVENATDKVKDVQGKIQKKHGLVKTISKLVATFLMILTLSGCQINVKNNDNIRQKQIIESIYSQEKVYDETNEIGNIEETNSQEKIYDETIKIDNIEEIKENEDFSAVKLYEYLHTNNIGFLPSNLENCIESVNFSNRKENIEKVQKSFELYKENFRVDVDENTKVIFMIGTQANLNSACACPDINTIIIPVDNFDNSLSEEEIFTKFAHEYTHILNFSKIQSAQMARLEDEAIAQEIGIIVDNTYEHDLLVNTRYHGQRKINHVSAMDLLGFYSILDNKGAIVNKFIELIGDSNVNFNDICYADVLFGNNNLGVPVTEGIKQTEVGIVLRYGDTSLLYIVDTGIDINGTNLEQYELDSKTSFRIEIGEQDNVQIVEENQLTMTWLSNILRKLGINKEQKIVNIIENPIIVLGIFFPKIKNWFIKEHKVQDLEKIEIGLDTIIKNAGMQASDSILSMGFAKKLSTAIATIFNKQKMQDLAKYHTVWNAWNPYRKTNKRINEANDSDAIAMIKQEIITISTLLVYYSHMKDIADDKEELRNFFMNNIITPHLKIAKRLIGIVVEESIKEIKKNPEVVSMGTELYKMIGFDECDLSSIGEFIKNNDELYSAIINIFAESLQELLELQFSMFTLEDYDAFRNYIYFKGVNEEDYNENEKLERAKRESQIKLFARIYGYIVFKDEFYKQHKNEIMSINSTINMKGYDITIGQWIHICDGHCLFINGNELKDATPSIFSTEKMAFDSAIRLKDLELLSNIKKSADIIFVGNGRISYEKEIEGKIYHLVEENGVLVTFFAIDPNKKKDDYGGYDVCKFIDDSKSNIQRTIFIRKDVSEKYYVSDASVKQNTFIFDEENVLYYLDTGKKIFSHNKILNLNGRYFLSSDSAKIYENMLTVFQFKDHIYYYGIKNKCWYEYNNNNFEEKTDENQIKEILKILKQNCEVEFIVNKKTYIFVNNMFFYVGDDGKTLINVEEGNIGVKIKYLNGTKTKYFICSKNTSKNKNQYCFIFNPIKKIYEAFKFDKNKDFYMDGNHFYCLESVKGKKNILIDFGTGNIVNDNSTIKNIKNNVMVFKNGGDTIFEIDWDFYYHDTNQKKLLLSTEKFQINNQLFVYVNEKGTTYKLNNNNHTFSDIAFTDDEDEIVKFIDELLSDGVELQTESTKESTKKILKILGVLLYPIVRIIGKRYQVKAEKLNNSENDRDKEIAQEYKIKSEQYLSVEKNGYNFNKTPLGIIIGIALETREINRIFLGQETKQEFLERHTSYNDQTKDKMEAGLNGILEKMKQVIPEELYSHLITAVEKTKQSIPEIFKAKFISNLAISITAFRILGLKNIRAINRENVKAHTAWNLQNKDAMLQQNVDEIEEESSEITIKNIMKENTEDMIDAMEQLLQFKYDEEISDSQLTMTWLSNLLDRLNITDFNKRQKIINTIENPIIVLGIFFPKIKNWFIKEHKGQDLEKIEIGLDTIIKNAGMQASDSILSMGFAKKLSTAIATIFNKQKMQDLADAHAKWNESKIDVIIEKLNDLDNYNSDKNIMPSKNLILHNDGYYKSELLSCDSSVIERYYSIVEDICNFVKNGNYSFNVDSLKSFIWNISRYTTNDEDVKKIVKEYLKGNITIDNELIREANINKILMFLYPNLKINSKRFNSYKERLLKLNPQVVIYIISEIVNLVNKKNNVTLSTSQKRILNNLSENQIQILINILDKINEYNQNELLREYEIDFIVKWLYPNLKINLKQFNRIKERFFKLELETVQYFYYITNNAYILSTSQEQILKKALNQINNFNQDDLNREYVSDFIIQWMYPNLNKNSEEYKNYKEHLDKLDLKNLRYLSSLIINTNQQPIHGNILKNILKQINDSNNEFNKDEIQFICGSIVPLCFINNNVYRNMNEEAISKCITGKINKDILKFINYKYDKIQKLKSTSIIDLLFIDKIDLSGDNNEILINLLEKLNIRNITNLDLSNGGLTIKIFLNKKFQEYFKNNNTITRYRMAMKINEFISLNCSDENMFDFVNDNLDIVIPEAIKALEKALEISKNKVVIDKKTKILMACHNELKSDGTYRCTEDHIKTLLKKIGFNDEEIKEHLIVYRETEENKNKETQRERVDALLKEIPNFRYIEGEEENLLVTLFGHGGIGIWMYSKDGYIYVSEFANSIEQLIKNMRSEGRTEQEIQNTIEHITLDLSCCYSYKTAQILKQGLLNKGIKYCPQILTMAGKEINIGYEISKKYGDTEDLPNNLIYSIFEYINDKYIEKLTFGDIFNSKMYRSDHTIFMIDDQVKTLYDEFSNFLENAIESMKKIVENNDTTSDVEILSRTTILPSTMINNYKNNINEEDFNADIEQYSITEQPNFIKRFFLPILSIFSFISYIPQKYITMDIVSVPKNSIELQTNTTKKILKLLGVLLYPIVRIIGKRYQVKAEKLNNSENDRDKKIAQEYKIKSEQYLSVEKNGDNFNKTPLGIIIGVVLETREINRIFLEQESKQEFLERHTSYNDGDKWIKDEMQKGLNGILEKMKQVIPEELYSQLITAVEQTKQSIPEIFKATFIFNLAISITAFRILGLKNIRAINRANIQAHKNWNLQNQDAMLQQDTGKKEKDSATIEAILSKALMEMSSEDYFALYNLLREENPNTFKHSDIYSSSSMLMNLVPTESFWAYNDVDSTVSYPWKIHLYADSEDDWGKMVEALTPYLEYAKFPWKTIGFEDTVEELNEDDMQKGKTFTIYPRNKEEFINISIQLDKIIRGNNLVRKHTNILGDRALGSTGRIFYRYTYNTGKYKDILIEYNTEEDMLLAHNLYEENRGNNNYLANDMTEADDPFYNFDPYIPESSKSLPEQTSDNSRIIGIIKETQDGNYFRYSINAGGSLVIDRFNGKFVKFEELESVSNLVDTYPKEGLKTIVLKDIKEDYVSNIVPSDKDVSGAFYLEDMRNLSDKEIKKILKEMIVKNKKIVLYVSRQNIDTEIPINNLIGKYNEVEKDLRKFSSILSEIIIDEEYLNVDSTKDLYGNDIDVSAKILENVFIMEILKNSLVHGNKMNITMPIIINIDSSQNKIEISNEISKEKLSNKVSAASEKLHGFGMAIENIKENEIGIDYLAEEKDGMYVVTLSSTKKEATPSNTKNIDAKKIFKFISPLKYIMNLINNIFEGNQYMTGKNVIVDFEVGEQLKQQAKEKGINIVKLKVVKEEIKNVRGGQFIDTQKRIKMKYNKKTNELLVYSKQGISVDIKTIKEMIAKVYAEGRRNLNFKEGEVIAFVESTDTTIKAIENRLKNAEIDSIQKAEIEMSLDLSEVKNVGKMFRYMKKNNLSANTIVLNSQQVIENKDSIKELQQEGYRFILRGTMGEISDAFGYADSYLDGAILIGAKNEDIKTLELISANNVDSKIHIETQMYVDMSTAKDGIDIEKVYNEHGIIPIVNVQHAQDMIGKYAMDFSSIKSMSNSEVSKLMLKGNVVNIMCNANSYENGKNELEQARTMLSEVFDNMFATVGELLKPKSIEQRIKEEERIIGDYKEKLSFENVGEIKEALKDKNNILRNILTTEITEENQEKAKELVDKFMKTQYYSDCSDIVKMRIETQIKKNEYIECIGTIKGVINQTIDSILLSGWEGINREKYLENKYEESRQYIRIKAIQLLMIGENIEDIMKKDIDSAATVEQLFDMVKTELNKDVKLTIINNKNSIKEISLQEKAKTIEDFINMNILLKDSLLELKVTKEIKISALAVKNILSAA